MSATGHAVRLARIDVTRAVRKHTTLRGTSSSALGLLVYALLLVGGSLGGGYLGSWLGRDLATGALPADAIGFVRGTVALFWLVGVAVYVARTVGQRGVLARPEGILTVVPTSQALVGVLLAEYVYYLLWTIVPATALGVGLAVGTGTLTPAVAVPAAVALAGVGSVAVGYPVGLAIRHVASRFAVVARNKGRILVFVFAAYFVALSTGVWNDLLVRLLGPLQDSPPGWYADLLLVGAPAIDAAPARAVGAVGLTVAVAVVGTAAGARLAARHWFSDPALAGAAESRPADVAPGVDRRLAPIVGRPTAALVVLSWRRARRSPLKLLYAFYPLLVLAGLFASIVRSGEIPAYLPYAVVVFAAWAAGVVFTLNPLGDQGAALPSTLLSGVDGRRFVGAHVLAGLVVAVPLGTIAVAAVAVLGPLDRPTTGALVVATPVAMVASAALAVGLGTAVPRFEETTVTKSMETVLPSRWAFALFSLYLFGTAGAAIAVSEPPVRELAAGLVTWVLPVGLSVDADALYLVAAVALVPLLVAPFLSYRYAIRRFDRYTLE